jgi:prepilin-type N-terminal cleavage/methylation domain-containing protein/prepilin-type processing-associated H-X9-DG protein
MKTQLEHRTFNNGRIRILGGGEAFTLLELLVVMAAIGILASLATPVFTKTTASGRSVVCANNLRQLQSGWQLYADDNEDRLVHNVAAQDTGDLVSRSFPGSWVTGTAKTDLTTHNLEAGSLFPFVNSCAVYHCPADRSTVTNQPSTIRFRSYSLSGSLGGLATFHPAIRASDLDKSGRANVFAFVDENESSIDDGLFGLGANPDYHWLNLPSTRHGRWTNLSFTDGHVASQRWRAPKIFFLYNQQAADSGDLQDLRDLQRGLPVP